MNSEQQRLESVLQCFLANYCDDPVNGTKFDCDFIDAIRELQNRYADEPEPIMTDECKQLRFKIRKGSGICGCSTIPCFGGKMPYQSEPIVCCAISRTMCDESPVQIVREIRAYEKQIAHKKEKARLAKNATARRRYKEEKIGESCTNN